MMTLTPDSRLPAPDEGLALWRAGRLDEALEVLGRALDARPHDAVLRTSFGLVLASLGLADAASAAWRQVLALAPVQPAALVNLANAVGDAPGAGERARLLCRRALAADAADAAALGNLGVHEERRGARSPARRFYRRALALMPAEARLWSNLGSLEHWDGRLAAAGRSLDRALALVPDFAAARFDRAVNRLLQGDEARGLAEYEWRWRRPSPPRPAFGLKRWDGAPLAGRRLLLWTEQGFGDAIQFARFAGHLRDGAAALLCQAPLLRLMRSVEGLAAVAAYGESVPAADLEAPLMSLPHLLGVRLSEPTMTRPYLAADAADVARWRPFLDGLPQGMPRIGVVWSGRPDYAQDRARSLPPAALAPLLSLRGFIFVSLQHGDRQDIAAQPSPLAAPLATPQRPRAFVDFADTAALISGLDLVIAADTAVAHLAGALARPVWILLPKVPDWRWGMSGASTPWYPSARLFRQGQAGDWSDVVAAVMAALPTALPMALPAAR
jgi:Flp pilus assembly protein TadD